MENTSECAGIAVEVETECHHRAPWVPENILTIVGWRVIALLELDQGRPVAQLATPLGITRQTLYNWIARFEGGPSALQDRAGRGRPTAWTAPVQRFLLGAGATLVRAG